jgi:hypothetical protein
MTGRTRIAVVIGTCLAASAALAEGERAADRLQAMATFLAAAPRLAVTIDAAYDVLQSSGQKIEFGERRTVTLRRPDRVRVDVTRRDGSRRGVVYDGTQLVAFDSDENVYTTVEKPGGVDAALDYFVETLDMRLPLRELLVADLPQRLKAFGPARLVGEEQLDGVATDHIASRGEATDVELWIPRDGGPLPKRIVITYRLAPGQPQFAADLAGWNLSPEAPDSLFTFTPAPGMERIRVMTPQGKAN